MALSKSVNSTIAFLIDVVLAALVMVEFVRLHKGYVIPFVVYAILLGLLRGADNWAQDRSWKLWQRVALKVGILAVAEALVLLSGMEACEPDMSACHRVFF